MANGELFIAGRWESGPHSRGVFDKFTNNEIASAEQASARQVERAIGALVDGHNKVQLPPYERYEILSRAASILAERRAEISDVAIGETGFTVSDVESEIDRAIQTLTASAEEAKRLIGDMVPLGGAPGVRNRIGFTLRVPVGVVCAITPFNSPINTVCHKIGPAIAGGNTVLLKPSSHTPLSGAAIVEVLLEAGLPSSHIALINGSSEEIGPSILGDDRIDFYTFTGSTGVGRLIRKVTGLRRLTLELGGLSSTIICDDAKLPMAVEKCITGAFRKAGQVCTSVQRLYVHESIYDSYSQMLVEALESKTTGDPRNPETFVGPMIGQGEAARVRDWVTAALKGGARRLSGTDPEDQLFYPTVLTDVDVDMKVMCEEVFGPVVSLRRFADLESAVEEINDTPYGLSAGVFTGNLDRISYLACSLRVGSVHFNQSSSSRIDLMPYGGVKDSGFGKEGPKYAIREMTEERLVTISY